MPNPSSIHRGYFTLSLLNTCCKRYFQIFRWSSGKVFVSGAGGLSFKSPTDQIRHWVARGSPPLRHFFEKSFVALAQWCRSELRKLMIRFGVITWTRWKIWLPFKLWASLARPLSSFMFKYKNVLPFWFSFSLSEESPRSHHDYTQGYIVHSEFLQTVYSAHSSAFCRKSRLQSKPVFRSRIILSPEFKKLLEG